MTRSWGYPNGQIPASAMVAVRGELFQPGAAAAMDDMIAACLAETGFQMTITQGYRPLGAPTDAPDSNAATQWGAWNNYKLHGSPIAASPGTSNHGDGCAADMGNGFNTFGTNQHNWMVANAPRWGWRWGSTPSEPWHIDYIGPLDYQGDADMPLTDADVAKIWTYSLGNQAGQTVNGKKPVFGRAADWLTNMSDAVGVTQGMVAAIKANPSSVIDPAKLAAALVAAGVNVTVDTAGIVKALDASLADDFAAIPSATVDALADKITDK